MPLDYCDKPEEASTNPDAKHWIKLIANGNEYAYTFMWDFWCFTHLYDDLVDGDKDVSGVAAAHELVKFVAQITFNPFYQNNREQLFSLIVQAVNRWLDGDEWERSNDPEKVAASSVIRCGDIEIYAHCAFLIGGWEHMRAMKGLRSYDMNSSKELA